MEWDARFHIQWNILNNRQSRSTIFPEPSHGWPLSTLQLLLKHHFTKNFFSSYFLAPTVTLIHITPFYHHFENVYSLNHLVDLLCLLNITHLTTGNRLHVRLVSSRRRRPVPGMQQVPKRAVSWRSWLIPVLQEEKKEMSVWIGHTRFRLK